MMRSSAIWFMGLIYLLLIFYFAFKPFQHIPGRCYEKPVAGGWVSTEGIMKILPGAAFEDRGAAATLRRKLMKADQLSIEVVLRTDSLNQVGPARILSFSRNSACRNFTLAQNGNGLEFRLRTTETDFNGIFPSLLVPGVFDDQTFQQLIVTYDGEKVCLYVDGQLHPSSIELTGRFDNWGRNHLLIMGDEVPGGRPWSGSIKRVSIYDRALGAVEVASLYTGASIPGAVYLFPGIQKDRRGMRRIKYRNLFVFSDSVFTLHDCIFNTAGFMPLAILLWLILPEALRRYRFAAGVLLPLMLGLAVSGAIEFAQRGILGRVPCLVDLMYNFVGTLLGCLLLWFMIFISKKGEST